MQSASIPIADSTPDIFAPASGQARALPISSEEWPAFVASLKLVGIVGQLAAQTELIRCEGRELVLALPEAQRHLADKPYVDKLKTVLDEALGGKVRLTLELCSGVDASLAAQDKRERDERKAQTEAAFRDEPFVREVLARFDAKIRPGSIKPV
jgi:DNA polymerase-3 subunit gamma/tau